MSLKLRPTGLGSGIDKDRQDYTVYTGGWDIGRIYETRGAPEHPPARDGIGPSDHFGSVGSAGSDS